MNIDWCFFLIFIFFIKDSDSALSIFQIKMLGTTNIMDILLSYSWW